MQVKNNLFEEDSEVALWKSKSKTTEYMLPLNSYTLAAGVFEASRTPVTKYRGTLMTKPHPSDKIPRYSVDQVQAF